ncbi:MAG: DUF2330 domain-containing protein, partial [Polyangiales bacterium]
VPGVPDVEVSSDLAFQRLQSASNPQYVATQVVEGRCREGSLFGTSSSDSDTGPDSNASFRPNDEGGVAVLASGTIGPYDFVVIQPDASFEAPGDVAVDWLADEGYDVVPPEGDADAVAAMLGTYFQGGMNLLAFRLTKGNDAGTIRPVRITYESEQPMIPIRPTAVAANDDMGVLVWVVGADRAVPINYRSLELNEALIDWRQSGANYNQVVIAAANEAGGQGFVTERAGPASTYENVILAPGERDQWESIANSVEALPTSTVVTQSVGLLRTWDGFEDVALRHLPGRLDGSGLFICEGCNQLTSEDLDTAAFVRDLEAEVVNPMLETEDLLLSRPYVTRLYTTLSAPEMDRDPLFDFNPDLEDASNVHNATWVIECKRELFLGEAPSRFELEDGRVVRLEPGAPWPFIPGDSEAPPANALVVQLSTSGQGEVVEDNRPAIDALLSDHNNGVIGGGCAVGYGDPPITPGGLLLIALVLGISRRHRSQTG